MQNTVKIQQLPHSKDLPLPSYATTHSAGMDLFAAIGENITISPGQRRLVPTGTAIALSKGLEAQIRPRSGLALKHGITVLNSPGTIDADYRGEVMVLLINHGTEDFTVERGMKIAQMIITEYKHITWQLVEQLEETTRGAGGFGSTGMK